MTTGQKRIYEYQADDSTYEQLNRSYLGIIPYGVYAGFDADIAGSTGLNLDILQATTGLKRVDVAGVEETVMGIIKTRQGVLIHEYDDIQLAITLTGADGRKDIIVCDHVYLQTTGGAVATYSVIEGVASGSPVAPSYDSKIQTLIGTLEMLPNETDVNSAIWTKATLPTLGGGDIAFRDRDNTFTKINTFSGVVNFSGNIVQSGVTTALFIDVTVDDLTINKTLVIDHSLTPISPHATLFELTIGDGNYFIVDDSVGFWVKEILGAATRGRRITIEVPDTSAILFDSVLGKVLLPDSWVNHGYTSFSTTVDGDIIELMADGTNWKILTTQNFHPDKPTLDGPNDFTHMQRWYDGGVVGSVSGQTKNPNGGGNHYINSLTHLGAMHNDWQSGTTITIVCLAEAGGIRHMMSEAPYAGAVKIKLGGDDVPIDTLFWSDTEAVVTLRYDDRLDLWVADAMHGFITDWANFVFDTSMTTVGGVNFPSYRVNWMTGRLEMRGMIQADGAISATVNIVNLTIPAWARPSVDKILQLP